MSFLDHTNLHLRFPKSFGKQWTTTYFEQKDKTLVFTCPACDNVIDCFKVLHYTLFPLYAFADKRFKDNKQLQVLMEAIISSIGINNERRIFYRADVILPSDELTFGQIASLTEWDLWEPPLFDILLKMKRVSNEDNSYDGAIIIHDIMRRAQFISILPLFYYFERDADGIFLNCNNCGSLITDPGE